MQLCDLRSRLRRCFTLLEVSIAIVLVSLVLLSVLALSASSTQIRNVTAERDVAREAARAKLEEIAATDFDSIEAVFFAGGDHLFEVGTAPNLLKSGTPGVPAGRAVLEQTPTAAEPNLAIGPDGMKKVTVEVRWRSQGSAEERLSLSTYLVSREAR